MFSFSGVVYPAIHLRLLLLRARYIESIPEPTCSGCKKSIHLSPYPSFARSASGTSSVESYDHKRVFKAMSASSVLEGCCPLPSETNVTRTSVLRRRCLLCYTKIRLDIRPIMCQRFPHLAHGKCSGISCYAANPSLLCYACSLPTTSITTPMHQLCCHSQLT